jgi:nucleoside-diphosphate-sugar epimerase
MLIYIAGATGAIGTRLIPLLLQRGHTVFGMSRSPSKATALGLRGVQPVVLDVFDRARVIDALVRIRPEIVIHQLTDLPRGLDPSRMAEGIERNARIRREGTANLVAAALASHARRFIAQSIAWVYAPGPLPFSEECPLHTQAEGPLAATVGGVVALEEAVLGAPALEGVVLRYGRIYGPGTGSESIGERTLPLHVDAAAWAACLAVDRGRAGVYNVVARNGEVDATKARIELGWREDMRVSA